MSELILQQVAVVEEHRPTTILRERKQMVGVESAVRVLAVMAELLIHREVPQLLAQQIPDQAAVVVVGIIRIQMRSVLVEQGPMALSTLNLPLPLTRFLQFL
jgi:hypothetical protein